MEMKKITKKDLAKYEMNVLSPRSYNYLKLKTKNGEGIIEIEPTLHVRDEALLDVIFNKFVSQDSFKALKELPYDNEKIWADKFDIVVHNQNNEGTPRYNIIIELDSKEIRKTLGLSHLTDKEISERADNLNRVLIRAEDVKIWYESGEKYRHTVTWKGNIIKDVITEKTDRIAPRTKNIQHRFFFRLEDATVMLFANDSLFRRISLFPKKFYHLPYGCQRLFRYLSIWNEIYLSLEQIADILGWKSIPHTPTRKKQVEKHLERLKKEGYIVDWRRRENTRGLRTVWFIWGINPIRKKPPKALKEFHLEGLNIEGF